MKKLILTLLLILIVIIGYFVIRKSTQTINIPTSRVNYTGNGVQFRYPKTFGATVWKSTTRPPLLTVVSAGENALAIGCPMLVNSSNPPTKTEGTTQYGVHYTLYTWWDIGAGSLYTSRCYLFSWDTKNYVLNFEMRSHSGCGDGNCGAYCETPSEQECKDFDMNKDVIDPIEKIISTFQIIQ